MNGFSNLLKKLKSRLFGEWFLQKNRLLKLYRNLYSEQHQLTSTTSHDRYPALFEQAKNALPKHDNQNISILSFGCSTGEECFSLTKYFANSTIVGVDINKINLIKAGRKNVYSNVKFKYSTEENIQTEGPYQVIFCLSVLCRWEDTKYVENCEKIYPFEKFQATVKMLSKVLLPGGLILIYNSNFRFEDTAVFVDDNFEIVETRAIQDSGFVYKFDKMNNRIHETHVHCIYRKKLT